MLSSKWLAAAAALVVGLAGPARAELISNGSFENGFVGFTVSGDNVAVSTSGGLGGYPAQSGNSYAALGSINTLGSISQTINDVAGQNLTLSFYLASNGRTPNQFRVNFNSITLLSLANVTTQDYTLYSFNVVGTGSDVVTFLGQDSQSYLALDNVSLVQARATAVPEPFSVALLGSGLAALAFTRRRPQA